MWTCSECSNQNWDSSKACVKCKEPISPELEKEVIIRTQIEIKNHKPRKFTPPQPPADPQVALNCEEICANFEGKEAFYFEKGVLRVRVFNIRYDLCGRRIDMEVEEIPTKGLEQSYFHRHFAPPSPIRWSISSGYLAMFSEQCLAMGYGGWTLEFKAEVVRDLIAVAGNWPGAMDACERYSNAREILRRIRYKYSPNERSRRVFPEETDFPLKICRFLGTA
jgi:hypothetical protein